ncbi:MAG: hypothetical protein PWP27_204 [Clostridiales bacterium]|jgi:hypothetical protein|nr:hypothetical protein [Clostridiales bacterium]
MQDKAKHSDFRIFYCNTTEDFIICNDFKKRQLIKFGYSEEDAEYYSHGHLKSRHMAEKIRDRIVAGKYPATRNHYLLECYIRVAYGKEYTDHIKNLLAVRRGKGKKLGYKNNKVIKR